MSHFARHLINSFCLLAVLTLVVGCGGDEGDMPELPEGPDATVEAVADGLAAGEPIVVWAAMPESYRADVTELVHSFGGAVDAEVYDKTFTVIGKLADVLASQKSFFLNHPMVQQNPQVDAAQLSENWDAAVDALQTLTGSPIATAEGLTDIDIAAFLNDEGETFMQHMKELSEAASDNPMAQVGNTTAKVVGEADADGVVTVEVTDPDGITQEVQMVEVEGRWVPKEMADDWDQQIADTKQQIAQMSEQGMPNKAQAMGMLTGMETAIDQLAAAETQEQFNQQINQVLGGLMGAMMMQQGGMGGPMGPQNGMPSMPGQMPNGMGQ